MLIGEIEQKQKLDLEKMMTLKFIFLLSVLITILETLFLYGVCMNWKLLNLMN